MEAIPPPPALILLLALAACGHTALDRMPFTAVMGAVGCGQLGT
jgi:hypothetical protein